MRLLKQVSNGEIVVEEFFNTKVPAYVILSHTWGPKSDEVTFKDLREGTWRDKPGSTKLHFCARQAPKDGYVYFWIDSCCIDNTNLTELSEAINSMFRWYKEAKRCYVYLSDVPPPSADPAWELAFHQSRWFTRGWTLQELLAPKDLYFFSKENENNENEKLGSKNGLEHQIHKITGIPVQALQKSDLSQFTPRKRLSWAKKRNTTRQEDKAYSLLGIFGISMDLRYGERHMAWKRLIHKVKEMQDGDVKQDSQSEGKIEPGEIEDDTNSEHKNRRLSSSPSRKCWLLYIAVILTSALLILWAWNSPPPSLRPRPLRPLQTDLPIFAIIGRTGAGKSTFIQNLGGLDSNSRPPPTSDALEPCTYNITFYRFNIYGTEAYIFDTPGFDDVVMSDTQIMTNLFNTLNTLSLVDKKIRFIYLYDISNPRFGGEAHKNIAYFESLVGLDNAESVALVTGRWRSDPTEDDTRVQLIREKGLKENYWKPMLEVGAKYERHDGSRKSALLIVQRLLQKPVMLKREPGWVREKLKIIEEREEMKRMAEKKMYIENEEHPFYSAWNLWNWLLLKFM